MRALDEEKFRRLYGTELRQRGKRFITYIDRTPASRIFMTTTIPPLLGMTLGGTVGGVVGCIGGPKGVFVGASSGVGVGLLAGGVYAGYSARREYHKWLKQHRSDEVLSEFTEAISQQVEFEEFVCPLTKEIMHYPFLDPYGNSFEKKAIEVWVKKKGTSPVTKAPLKISDLRPNYVLMGMQARFYRELLRDETSKMYLSSIQKRGIEALLRDLDEQIRNCFDAENKFLHSLMLRGKISAKDYSCQLSDIVDVFYH